MMRKRTTPHGSCRPMGSIVLTVTIQNIHCSLTSLVLSTWPVFVSLQPIVYDKPIWYDSIFFCARPHTYYLANFLLEWKQGLWRPHSWGWGHGHPSASENGVGGYPWCYLTQHKKHSLQLVVTGTIVVLLCTSSIKGAPTFASLRAFFWVNFWTWGLSLEARFLCVEIRGF